MRTSTDAPLALALLALSLLACSSSSPTSPSGPRCWVNQRRSECQCWAPGSGHTHDGDAAWTAVDGCTIGALGTRAECFSTATGCICRPLLCERKGNTSCSCEPLSAVASSVPTEVSCGPSGQYRTCCASPDGTRCYCDSTSACRPDYRATATCEVASITQAAGATGTCEGFLQSTRNGGEPDGGARCPGSGYVSCATGADCPCGLTCARLNTSSTERWCTQSCATDGECSTSPKWRFSSTGCNPLTRVCTP